VEETIARAAAEVEALLSPRSRAATAPPSRRGPPPPPVVDETGECFTVVSSFDEAAILASLEGLDDLL
jgi:hypothetical protein